MPWSDGTRNPYKIWLSEVIMQQTRIEQGTAYYLKFLNAFPSITELAATSQDEIIRLWEGLGYYTRARNLHKAAKYIVETYGGKFPERYEDLIALPGIGPYSAAAISSFAFQKNHVVVDGNVKRLIARYAGIYESIDNAKTHQKIKSIAENFMDGYPPDIFNQAIMNFGSLVCSSKPLCFVCHLSDECIAFQTNSTKILPVRNKKPPLRNRYFHFLVIRDNEDLLLHKRTEQDIWQDLYSFPFIERSSLRSPGNIQLTSAVSLFSQEEIEIEKNIPITYTQTLSHQLINARFHIINVKKSLSDKHEWMNVAQLNSVAKPRIIINFLNDYLRSKTTN